jgi:Zn-finger in ubiquitin-hydrolases and other protein
MTDLDGIEPSVPPSGPGCADCMSATPPGWWFHLRRCATCGHVGCCDSSPSQHSRAHFQQTGHRVIQSFEPGEDWFWDFTADDFRDGPVLAAPHSHPENQPTPGPAGAVPHDWVNRLHR